MIVRFLWSHLLGAGALLCAGLTAMPAFSAEEMTLRVGKSVGPAFAQVPIDVGIQYGLFKDQGLDIELTSFGGGGNLSQAMIADSVDIGITATPELALIPKGATFKAITLLGVAPYDLIIVIGNDSSIKTVDDLKGKKIAVTGMHSLTAWLTKDLSRIKGWGVDGIKLVGGNSQTGHIAMMRTGEIDGAVSDISLGYDFEEKNQGRILLKFGDFVPELATGVVTATDHIMHDNPKAVRAFAKGWVNTIAFIYAEKEKAIPVFARVMNRSTAVATKSLDAVLPTNYFSRNGRFDPKIVMPLADAYVSMGLLDRPPDMTRLYTEEFLPK
jgi:NitT/TauT family transport system substrate-binding protein